MFRLTREQKRFRVRPESIDVIKAFVAHRLVQFARRAMATAIGSI